MRAGRGLTWQEYKVLKAIASIQFGRAAAEALLPSPDRLTVYRGKGGRPRSILLDGDLILVWRPTDGYFSLTLSGAKIVKGVTRPPRLRVIVKGDREIRGSVLARDVLGIDPLLRVGDEVIVVDRDDRIVGVGRLRVPPRMVEGLERGEVVRVRKKVV